MCSYFLKELLPFTAALEVLQHGGNFVSFLLTVRNLLTPVLFQVTSLYGNSIIIRIFFKKKKKPSTSSCRIFIKYMYHSLRLGDILIHVTLHSKFKKIIILINVHEHLGKHKPCHLPHRNQGIYRPVTLSMGCLISSFLH